MAILDRLFGSDKAPEPQYKGQSADDQAIARYRYMLDTAPPETIEQAHAEAFAKLTPEQRRMVLKELSAAAPEAERAAAAQSGADPRALARMATRAEVRQPGTMERMFGRIGGPGGVGLGGLMAGSLLSTIAGTVIGSMIAQQFFSHDSSADAGGSDAGHDSNANSLDDGQNVAADDSGGDFGGGDFGGGDFEV